MTTPEDSRLCSTEDVEAAIAQYILPKDRREDRVGLEIEGFPFLFEQGKPPTRVQLRAGTPSLVELISAVAAVDSDCTGGEPSTGPYITDSGGRITFEPGAQIEYSTAPWTETASVIQDANRVWDTIGATLSDHDMCLVSIGVDPWNDAANIPQQLCVGRYQSMATYLGARGDYGALMMRNTCALQVNLDQGEEDQRDLRWLVGNLISPLLTAMFSTSPEPGAWSARARSWQHLDPTRTGFPTWDANSSANMLSDLLERALKADVIYVIRGEGTITGQSGWSFQNWLDNEHPRAGVPTQTDLETHLSTLFTEVRARQGVLELRGIDAIPQRWWLAPLTLTGAVVYDQRAAEEVTELLGGWGSKLNEVWHTAARIGLGDRSIRQAATKLGEIGLAAATRNQRHFDQESIDSTADFLESHTFRGISPGSVLEPLIGSPEAAIDWAVPKLSRKNS